MSKETGYKLTAFSLRFEMKEKKQQYERYRVSGMEKNKIKKYARQCYANFAFKEIRYLLTMGLLTLLRYVWEKLRDRIRLTRWLST